jgi:hypothetical protein
VRRDVQRGLVRKQEGIRPTGRSSVRWEDTERKCNGVDWVNMAQIKEKLWAFVNTAMDLWVLYIAGTFFTRASQEGPGSKKLILVNQLAILFVTVWQRVVSLFSPYDIA